MARKPATKPRKNASQERSRATVAAPRATAPGALPAQQGTFVKVSISATDGPKPWATPVQAYFRRTADGWQLVGLDRLP